MTNKIDIYIWWWSILNTLRPRQDGRRFPDDIFKCIFVNENVCILLQISLKFVPKVRIHNIPTLVQIMAWSRPGDKPLPEPMMVCLLTHICVTRPQWVKWTEDHYGDITWASLATPLFVEEHVQTSNKEKSKPSITGLSHDDVIKWKHFPRYWPFVRGIHRSPVNSPHKGQWRGALMFSLICVWINGWVNNREAGD